MTSDNDSPIPLLDLKAQLESIRPQVERAVLGVISEQRFILGPEVGALEREVAAYTGATHAVGVSSGTDALLLTLTALGVGRGDEVVTSAYSFFATAGSIARLGARPVLVDIDPNDFNLDPAAAAARISPRTRAVLPVHLFGRCAAVEQLREAAPDLPIVEDAAQAIGARRRGIFAGALGTAGCLSFFPSKNLGAYGDGGMITTDDAELAQRLRALRVHGQARRGGYQHELLGGNFRLDALQAAVLRVKLPHLERWTEARRANAARYRRLFEEAEAPVVLPPRDEPGCRDVYNQFVIRVAGGRRDGLAAHLKERQIGCAIYYPRGLHQQPCLASLGHREGDFPHTEAAARESLSIPVYPELGQRQQERVVGAVCEFLGNG
jgi:dTDP-4-amino-4,6-dideoxygalactose transaminase